MSNLISYFEGYSNDIIVLSLQFIIIKFSLILEIHCSAYTVCIDADAEIMESETDSRYQ